MQLKLLLFFVLALVVVVFSALNPQSVAVNFWVWEAPSVPLAAVIIVAVAVGALAMSVINLPAQVKQALKLRELARRLEQSDEALRLETARADTLDQRLEEILAAQSEAAVEPPGDEMLAEGQPVSF